jgi:endonuclease G, mitochondrial
MTIIDTVSAAADRESSFEDERLRQEDAARDRMVQRHSARVANEEALRGPDGMVKVNEPDRVAKRVNRVTCYQENVEPTRAAVAAPEILSAPAHVAEAQLEKIINVPDFLKVRYLEEGAAAARSVGRINIISPDGSRGFGTGFLVSPRLLLTNHHVLADSETARLSFVEFNYQDGIGGTALTPARLTFAPDRFFIADRTLDFALVAVDAEPDQVTSYGFNKLTGAQGTVLIGESVTIVQHPRGEKKQVVLRENKVIDIPELHVTYTADTEPGSSGSPVFNDQWEVIALHHASVPSRGNEQFAWVNEGVRISRILGFLRAASMPPDWHTIVDQDLSETPSAGPVAAPPEMTPPQPAPQTVSAAVSEPVEITVRFNGSVVHAVGTAEPAENDTAQAAEALAIDPDYTTRSGYDSEFLGTSLPLPEPSSATTAALSPELKYHHFSIRMHKPRRLAMFTAVNIRGPIDRIGRDSDRWVLDPRLSDDEQTGEAVYRDNPLDRGHLVRRLDPAWGPNAKAANDDTFHFTNCTPQHHDFNAGSKLWVGLEDYILNNADNRRLTVSVFTGPVLADDDPEYRGIRLPRQFWKIAAMVKNDGQLSVTGYLLSQTALLDDVLGREEFSFGAYRTFQVPVQRIADLTGLQLADFVAADPLERLEATTLPREVLREQDIIL